MTDEQTDRRMVMVMGQANEVGPTLIEGSFSSYIFIQSYYSFALRTCFDF